MTHLKRMSVAGGMATLAAAQLASAGDYTPTSPVRPSAGWLNDKLRANDPYMSAWDVGAQTRFRYEVREQFGIAGNATSRDFRDHGADRDNSFMMLRVRPRVAYTSSWLNVMVEGRHSSTTGDDRNPNLESDGPIDLHQAFVNVGNHKEFPVSVKLGRQELNYGDERLVGGFAWNNLGRVFDAAKVRWQNKYFAADFFTGRVVLAEEGKFNMPNDYDWFSGMYLSTKLIPKQTTELYALSRNVSAGSPTANAGAIPQAGGPPPRDIYTVGMRMKSTPGEWGKWDYTAELMGQFGHFNDAVPALPVASRSLEHQAFALFAGVGYTFTDAAWTPRLGIEFNHGSGDDNRTDDKHETFENLFPTNHKFYGFMDLASLQNLTNIRLSVSAKPLPRLNLLAEYHLFWLGTTSDNFYAVTGARRGGIGVTAGTDYGINPGYSSSLGSEFDLVVTYAVGPQIALELGYGHFFAGDYIKSSLSAPTHGAKDADFLYIQTTFNF